MRQDQKEIEIIDIRQDERMERAIRPQPSVRTGQRRARERRRRRWRNILLCLILFAVVVFGAVKLWPRLRFASSHFGTVAGDYLEGLTYPSELQERLEENPELLDFVEGYENRNDYIGKPIDISGECVPGEVPLLMQWDRRWGYDPYGDGMIGLDGCGPTCLSMAYIYLTGDTTKTPREMARFAYENGYYDRGKTAWALWEEGVSLLGLRGEEIPLDENRMKRVLDAGGLVVCSMGLGDFTTNGHFIVVTGYDDGGFYVNDPNRRSNSEKQWDYGTLQGQIKNLWSLEA